MSSVLDGIRLLVIDDDEDDYLLTRRLLRKPPFVELDIAWASSAQAGVSELLSNEFDACLLDFRLGPVTGLDVLRDAREGGSTTPTILLTGVGDHATDVQAAGAGAADYLEKGSVDEYQLERALRYAVQRAHSMAAAERLARIIDTGSDGLFVLSEDLTEILQVNSSAVSQTGVDEAELLASAPSEIWADVSEDELVRRLEPLRSEAVEYVDFQTQYRRADGTEFPVEITARRLANDRPPGYVLLMADISARLEQERQLAQAQRMESVGQLAGGLAHDFNNLLTIIAGNLDLMRSADEKLPTESEELVDEALSATRRGAELTRRLLAFSRRQPLEATSVDVNERLVEMEPLLRRAVGTSVLFRVEADDELWPLTVDAAQLETSLLNLVINSRDSIEDDSGEILIRANNVVIDERASLPGGEYVEITVRDTGSGIPEDLRERVLEPFFTTKSANRGSGLGLSMVYGFVSQSKGGLDIESTPGEGTEISVLLPRQKGVQTSARPRWKTDQHPQGLTFLVVDDNASLRVFVTNALRKFGYRVIEKDSADAAIDALRQGIEADAVLTDIVMPGENDGIDLCNHIIEFHTALPVMLMSGYSGERENDTAPDIPLLKKPFTFNDLSEFIVDNLDRLEASSNTEHDNTVV